MKKEHTLVSIGVIILKDDKILLGKVSSSDKGCDWVLPAGHLGYMESFDNAVKREVLEECGLEIENVRFHFVSNTKKYSPKHYIHISFLADYKSGEPEALESENVKSWEWFNVDTIPGKLSSGADLTIQAYKENKVLYDFN